MKKLTKLQEVLNNDYETVLNNDYETVLNHGCIYVITENEVVQVSYDKSYTIITFDKDNVVKLITDDYKELHIVDKVSEVLEILKGGTK